MYLTSPKHAGAMKPPEAELMEAHAAPPVEWSLKKGLPTPPASLFTIISAAGDNNTSLQRLARMISMEPSFTTELLRAVNTPFFGLNEEVRTVQQATIRLGTRSVRNLAVAHVVKVTSEIADTGSFDGVAFWESSLRRAISARVLAARAGYEDPMEAFTIGLIQDIGTLLIAACFPEHSATIQRAANEPAARRVAIERKICGQGHAEMFGHLARQWGLPADLVTAVTSHHHGPAPDLDRRARRLVHIAGIADLVADVVQAKGCGDTLKAARKALAELVTRDGEPLDLELLVEQIGEEMLSTAADMGYKVGAQPGYESLLSQTNQSLMQMNDDYEALTQRLERLLAEKEELTRALQEANEQLTRLACTDALTNVANRRFFLERLGEVLASCRAEGRPITVVMLDIDHFKNVNDTYGHAAGDDVLRVVSARIQKCLRDKDMVGRLGGEEFAMMFPGTSRGNGKVIAERLRRALADAPIPIEDGRRLPITASFGGVTSMPGDSRDPEKLLQASDEKLYDSKKGGRNRVTWAR